jgi:hypothetical protein
MRARRLAMAKAKSQNKKWRLDLPPLEDMYAVQTSISNVLEALAAGVLDKKTGSLILYGLQQAANNVRMTSWGLASHFAIHDYDENRVESYPGLESDFGLPKNADLNAAPEEAFPPPEELDPTTVFPPKKPPVSIEGLRAWKKVLAEAEQELKSS